MSTFQMKKCLKWSCVKNVKKKKKEPTKRTKKKQKQKTNKKKHKIGIEVTKLLKFIEYQDKWGLPFSLRIFQYINPCHAE